MSAVTPPVPFSPGSATRSRPWEVEIRPRSGWFDLDLGSAWRFRELLYYLVWRETKVRYKQAALGIAWAIIQPVFAVLIFTFVFGMFAHISSGGMPYPLFAFAAVLPWTYFAEAVRRSAIGLVADAELVRKIYFPRFLIPLSMIIAPMLDFALGAIVLLGLMAWYRVWPTWHILAVLPLLAVEGALALAMGLWLAPINVRFRDVMHTLPFMIQVWMYSTPIVYPLSIVPERWRALYSLNPMVGLVEGFRWTFLGVGSPDLHAILISLVVIGVAVLSGFVFFRRVEPTFADVI